ncbi:MAG: preprotein translocase [Pseudoalteromonas sp.]|uniref:tyrosine-type recombinase/integrase n=1 Tax=uncultured Pseudoalteromonas sp. TaxID=114053 RepID=UPI000C3C40AD|nr:site-specific integrase [uncultured Pseudoalteromonas sp.]MAB61779.1 preprotein translocase [Pseudoalteromonas sp.]|tara:strand:- start:2758 stop:4098 length:1341 start_codon:yes stop_codon:yes gene_type:complete
MAKSNNSTNRVNFTAERVRVFKCADNKKESFLWDSGCTGLGIRAYSSGKRSFIFQTSINGKTKRAVIGPVDSFDIDEARAKAREFQSKASDYISPAKVKKEKAAIELAEEQEELRGIIKLKQVWLEYIESNKSRWGEKHYKDHLKAIQEPNQPWIRGKGRLTKAGCLYPLINTKLKDLTPKKIESWLQKENETRAGVAAQTYRLLFACLNWCTEQEQYAGLIDVAKLKTKDVKKTVVKLSARTDSLQKEQLPAFFKYVRQIQNPVISAFVQTLLLTGARRNELVGLKWTELDLQWNSMTIRDKATSSGSDAGYRVIPLTPYVASLLINLPRRNEWVFSTPTGTTGKLTDPRKSVEPALEAAGIEGLTLHGLRRSFSNLSEWVEIPTGVVAQIMGHKPSATAEKHYKQRPLDLLRKWHTTLEAWILKQASVDIPAINQQRLSIVRGV